MSKKYTTLHPKGDTTVDLYPNIEAANIPDGSIGATKIYPNAIGNGQLAPNAVGYNNIQGGAVHTIQILDGAVTSDKIATGAVTNGKLDSNSVSSDKIIDGAVNAAKIENGSINNDKLGLGSINVGNMNFHLIENMFTLAFTSNAIDYELYFRIFATEDITDYSNMQLLNFFNENYASITLRVNGYDKTNNKVAVASCVSYSSTSSRSISAAKVPSPISKVSSNKANFSSIVITISPC